MHLINADVLLKRVEREKIQAQARCNISNHGCNDANFY